jgi:glycine cleavage system H protein
LIGKLNNLEILECEMLIPENLRYTKDHEWVKFDEEEGVVVIGITDYAQEKIGDITYVELPPEFEAVEKGKPFAEIEHHKGVEDVFCPVSGKVTEVNEGLADGPELINEDPYKEGWLVKIELEDPADLEELLDADEYRSLLDELEEEGDD